MRPVMRGLCHYESLIDGTLTLYHVAELNDALDVMEENNARLNAPKDKH